MQRVRDMLQFSCLGAPFSQQANYLKRTPRDTANFSLYGYANMSTSLCVCECIIFKHAHVHTATHTLANLVNSKDLKPGRENAVENVTSHFPVILRTTHTHTSLHSELNLSLVEPSKSGGKCVCVPVVVACVGLGLGGRRTVEEIPSDGGRFPVLALLRVLG